MDDQDKEFPRNTRRLRKYLKRVSFVKFVYFGIIITSIFLWLCILWFKLLDVQLVACALLQNQSIISEIFLKVIIPTSITIALFALAWNSALSGKTRSSEMYVGLFSLFLIPVYLISLPNIVVDDPRCLEKFGHLEEPLGVLGRILQLRQLR